MATDDLEDRIRARLRQLRFERGLSLRDLAAATGLSAATLSRIEGGHRRLTVAQLGVLAAALGSTPAGLLGATDPGGPSEARDGRTWRPVGPEHSDGRRVYRIAVPAGASEPDLHSHEGHQWLFVLQGRVRLLVEDDDRILSRGEAAEFDTWRPHWIAGVGEPAEILAIFSELGDPLRPIAAGERPRR